MFELEKLKAIRKELGFTQIEVAKKVGVSLTSYQLWERGVSKPNEENMKKLERALKE
jgi:transcriptional regulator with XRE-family HTH domain